jgi:hypothetical protein
MNTHPSVLSARHLGRADDNDGGFTARVPIRTERLTLEIGQKFPAAWASKPALDNLAKSLLGPNKSWRDVAERTASAS